MNRAEAQAILDSAHATAEAIVAARPELSYADSEALHDKVFFGLVGEQTRGMTIADFFDILSGP